MPGRWSCFGVVLGACSHAVAPTPPANHTSPPPHAERAASSGVLAWPVPAFTAVQIAEVKKCDAGKLASSRYPKTVALDALPTAFAPVTTCDRAALAAACIERVKDDASVAPLCLDSYRAAISANPAFAFSDHLVGGYFDKVVLVGAPPIAGRALTGLVLDYEWGGLGTSVKWTLTVRDLTTQPAISVTGPNAKTVAWSPDIAAAVAAFRSGLTSFFPIKAPLHAIDCTDNYPSWTASLTFDDGEKLELTTNASNLIGLGGPYQTTIGGTTYLQLSSTLTRATAELVKKVGLAIGQPMGEMCSGYDIEAAVLTP